MKHIQVESESKKKFYLNETTVKAAKELIITRKVRLEKAFSSDNVK